MKILLIAFAVVSIQNVRVPIASCLLSYEMSGMKPAIAARLCYEKNKLRKVTKL